MKKSTGEIDFFSIFPIFFPVFSDFPGMVSFFATEARNKRGKQYSTEIARKSQRGKKFFSIFLLFAQRGAFILQPDRTEHRLQGRLFCMPEGASRFSF